MTLSTPVILVTCALALSSTQAAAEVVINRPVPSMHTGRKFKAALSNPLTASWRNVDVRAILRAVSEDRKIAILLDRRIDPTQKLVVDINNLSVQEAIERIAKQVSAKVSVVGNSLYVGPPHGTQKLRTLIELRSQELLDVSSLPKGRRFDLVKRRTMHWNDLDRPVDLIGRIADRYKLKVEGLDGIGHDLWAGSTLPNVNAAEALSLVLMQFDRTFAWTERAGGIKIVAIPETVYVDRSYSLGLRSPSRILKEMRDAIHGLQAEARGRRIEVRGTIEQHEAVAELLRPRSKRKVTPKSSKPTPLTRQLFTLRLENAQVSTLMKSLNAKGVEFEYNQEELADAKIDLNQKISLNVTKAPAEDFFKRVFGPLGLRFSISERKVTLRPK